MKRFIAFALVLVLVLSLAVTAFAGKPSFKLTSSSYKNKTFRYGSDCKWKFKWNSGSYYRKSGKWRAKASLAPFIWYNYDWEPAVKKAKVIKFTGKGTIQYRLKSAIRGDYLLAWVVQYKSKKWKSKKLQYTYFYVR